MKRGQVMIHVVGLAVAGLLSLSGCVAQQTVHRDAGTSTASGGSTSTETATRQEASAGADRQPSTPETASKKTKTRPTVRLSSDVLLRMLSAEMMRQQGALAPAYRELSALLARQPSADTARQRFFVAHQMGDLKAMREAAARWQALAPDDPEPRRVLWLLAVRAGQLDEALDHLDAAIRLSGQPWDETFVREVAILQERLPDEQVEALLTRAQARYPDRWGPSVALARHALNRDDPETALAYLEQVAAAHPDVPMVYALMARAFLDAGQSRKGLKRLADAVARWPELGELQRNYAAMEMEVGRYAAAARRLEAILKRHPEALQVKLNLALVRMQMGELDKAQALLESLLDQPRVSQVAAYYLARLHEKREELETALEYYGQIRDPGLSLDAALSMVQLVARMKGVDRALSLLDQLSADTLDDRLKLLSVRARLLKEAGREEALVRTLRKMRQLAEAETDPDVRLEALLTVAFNYYEMDRKADYEAFLRSLLAQYPDNADILNALGYYYADENIRLDEAEQLIRRALAQSPDAAHIQDSMGWLYFRKGDLDAAARWLYRAWNNIGQPDEEVLLHLLELEAARGNWAAFDRLRKEHATLIRESELLREHVRALARKKTDDGVDF